MPNLKTDTQLLLIKKQLLYNMILNWCQFWNVILTQGTSDNVWRNFWMSQLLGGMGEVLLVSSGQRPDTANPLIIQSSHSTSTKK